jgi:tRNA(Ile2)-agmatinylcytidine synthase
MRLWVGIDDTDSLKGMCTTYIAFLIIEKLGKMGMRTIGFPRLIRLNPTIPFKTRGNGAVSFILETNSVERVMNVVNETILSYAELDDERTNPGAVFVDAENRILMNSLSKFAIRVVREVVSMDEAQFLLRKYMIPHLRYKLGRGLIGALAAIGLKLEEYTLEMLAYRYPKRFGMRKEYEEQSFYEADARTYPKTWDTVDWYNRIVVCIPARDPVLFGIRGTDLNSIREAFSIAKTEPFKALMFITNQGTDMHLIHGNQVKELENYRSYILCGEVVDEPYDIEGGHVFFTIKTRFGLIKCAAFEPTKQFRDVIRKLKAGDEVEVYGSMKKDTINLEKINILSMVKACLENPACPVCRKKMESAGKNQGFRCKRCKTKAWKKVLKRIEREVEEGFYEVPPCARRHISKPLIRMNVKRHVFR